MLTIGSNVSSQGISPAEGGQEDTETSEALDGEAGLR
jgi:hypothetical protein